MKPERWAEVDRVWHAVLARPEGERAAVIASLCAGDEVLRRDVESLLTNLADASAAGFGHLATNRESLIGRRLGPYAVRALLGVGGMGEVYRAHDSTLGREVAIKVLPEMWLADPDRQARFDREARLLATLNHPNIGSIYGIHESDGIRALVLELVEGETLAERIRSRAGAPGARRGLPIADVVDLAGQLIEALEAAHERGIVHRDLKPANIKITPGARLKVLDFGLARAASDGRPAANLVHSPTVTTSGTKDGMLLGTPPYMSPEQARENVVDKRTDIWAFGCVLYEMLTGVQAFGGDGVAEVLAGIITAEPDWSALPTDAPPLLRLTLRSCLHKDVRQRIQDIGDVRLAMAGAFEQPPREPGAERRRSSHARAALAGWAIAALTATLAAAVLLSMRSRPVELPETRLEIVTPPAADPFSLAMAPDGRGVVFQVGHEPPQLWLRRLDSQDSRPLAGTDGAQHPFWSPDSQSIAFAADGVLKRIDLASGLVRTLASRAPTGGAWGGDGTIIIGSSVGALYRVPADGGAMERATDLLPGQITHRWPQFLSDGRRFLLFSLGTPDVRGVYLGSLGEAGVRRISDRESGYLFMAPSHVLFARQGALWARRLGGDETSVESELVPVAPRLLVHSTIFGYSAFSSSSAGSIAYRASAGERQLVWLDRTGRRSSTLGQADDSQMNLYHLSPDGRFAAVSRTIAGNTNVWILDTERGVPRRATFDVSDFSAVFSPDGRRIAHEANGNRERTVVYERRSDGTGGEAVLLAEPEHEFHNPTDWSLDGRYLLFRATSTTGDDLRALPLFGERKPFDVARTPFTESNGRFSPDSRWVAYESTETGRTEVYIQTFPDPGPKSQISVGGGRLPRWRRDGRELFYLATDNRLMAVTITLRGPSFEAEHPRSLFVLPTASRYEPAPDGQRFLVSTVISEASPISIILNWKPPSQ